MVVSWDYALIRYNLTRGTTHNLLQTHRIVHSLAFEIVSRFWRSQHFWVLEARVELCRFTMDDGRPLDRSRFRIHAYARGNSVTQCNLRSTTYATPRQFCPITEKVRRQIANNLKHTKSEVTTHTTLFVPALSLNTIQQYILLLRDV